MQLEQLSEYLPQSVREIVEVVGFATAEKLVKGLGGVSFLFSEGEHYYPKLQAVVGEEAARILLYYWRGADKVYIPRCEAALRMARNLRFQSEFSYLVEQKNLSKRMAMLHLCPKFGISDRQGWKIISQASTNRPSQLFFDV